MKRTLKYCAVGFCVTVLLAALLLYLCEFIPQGLVQRHLAQSVPTLLEEGIWNPIGDRMANSLPDTNTDLLILTESVSTNHSDPDSFLTNPMYESQEGEEYTAVVERMAEGETEGSVRYYVRYWMGFRIIIRALLAVLDFYEIRRLCALAFFALAALCVYSLSNHLNAKVGLAFALSLILIKPHVVAVCFQFACCFLIAMSAMLLVPRLKKSNLPWAFLFMELGMLTMYFDFYTTPVITLAFPLTYLYLLRQRDGDTISLRTMLGYALAWGLGWLLMWLAKLALTSLLTDVDAFGDGFRQLQYWLTTSDTADGEEKYSFFTAMAGIFQGFYQYPKWLAAFLAALAVFALVYMKKLRRGIVDGKTLRNSIGVLFAAGLGLLWLVVTSRPAYWHSWFQYRTMAAIFWPIAAWLAYAIVPTPAESRRQLP